jgi:hypothetical protein
MNDNKYIKPTEEQNFWYFDSQKEDRRIDKFIIITYKF